MKTSSLIIGVADETPNRNMVETLFSQYLSLDINNPQEPQVQIDTTDVSILLLSLDRIVERVMSGDMSCGIASIGQLRKKMEARGKVPLLDLGYVTGFGKGDQPETPLYELGFTVDDRAYGQEVADDDFPAGLISLRTMRKNPATKDLVQRISEAAGCLYNTSSYFRQNYPRG